MRDSKVARLRARVVLAGHALCLASGGGRGFSLHRTRIKVECRLRRPAAPDRPATNSCRTFPGEPAASPIAPPHLPSAHRRASGEDQGSSSILQPGRPGPGPLRCGTCNARPEALSGLLASPIVRHTAGEVARRAGEPAPGASSKRAPAGAPPRGARGAGQRNPPHDALLIHQQPARKLFRPCKRSSST